MAKATGELGQGQKARDLFRLAKRHFTDPSLTEPKFTDTRPAKAIGAPMIQMVTAQELRRNLGDESFTVDVDAAIEEIRRDFMKPDIGCVMETVAPRRLHHRPLRRPHAQPRPCDRVRLVCFVGGQAARQRPGTDSNGLPDSRLDVGEGMGRRVRRAVLFSRRAWQAGAGVLARHEILVAAQRGDHRHAARLVAHRRSKIFPIGIGRFTSWAYAHFADPEHGEWYGYLHRDGSVSVPLKGNLWKGPFHFPRMQLVCWQLLEEALGQVGEVY